MRLPLLYLPKLTLPKRLLVLSAFCFMIGLSWSHLSHAKTLSLQTDRQVVELGDVMTVVVEADFQIGADLDLSLLEDQFEVLGRQRSNNIQIINGDFKSSTRWQIQLAPKQAGELMIPALTLDGVSSAAYPIRVQPLSQQSNGLEPYFLTASLNQSQAYVQQQVLYTLRFFYQGRFIDGGIRPPIFNQAQVTPISDQAVYTKQLNGQNYTVYEWVYALHPQKSGLLDIDPPMFNGQIQLQGRQKQVQIFAKPLTLTVLPEPLEFGQQSKNNWLPASQLSLTQQGLEHPKPLHVGDSISATITLQVNGLTANQLPDLTKLSQSSDTSGIKANQVKIYSEPQVNQDQVTTQGVSSQVQVKQTFIATQAGELTLPEQTLTWWNTQTNQLQTSRLPAQTFTILPAKITHQTTNVTQSEPAVSDSLTSESPNHVSRETDYFEEGFLQGFWQDFWKNLALTVVGLWVITLFIGWKMWRTRSLEKNGVNNTKIDAESENSDSGNISTSVNTQSKNKTAHDWCTLEPKAFYQRVREILHNDHGLTHLEDLALEPANEALWQAIQALEAHLFNQTTLPANTQTHICEQLNRLKKPLKSTRQTKTPPQSKLKSLYTQE